MNMSQFNVVETIQQDRRAEAEQARLVAQCSTIMPLRDRIRQAIGARLIAWGERLYVPDASAEVRP